MRSLSGWYRLFIVFAGIWTVSSGIVFYCNLPDKENIEKTRLDDIANRINRLSELMNKRAMSSPIKDTTFNDHDVEVCKLLDVEVLGLPELVPQKYTSYGFSYKLLDYVKNTPDKLKDEEVLLIVNEKWHELADLLISHYQNLNLAAMVQKQYEIQLDMHYKQVKKAIFYFFLYWLVPIGFVYGAGWTTWWIIKGFRKDN